MQKEMITSESLGSNSFISEKFNSINASFVVRFSMRRLNALKFFEAFEKLLGPNELDDLAIYHSGSSLSYHSITSSQFLNTLQRVLSTTPGDSASYLAHAHLLPPSTLNTIRGWTVWEAFLTATLPVRQTIARSLTPKSYACNNIMYSVLSAVPRPMTVFLKAMYGKRALVGAEIGVAAGDNALSILRTLNMQRLFLIDPYTSYLEGKTVLSYGHLAELAQKRLKMYPQAKFMRYPSQEAKLDELLDFVYIDGDHSFKSVVQDIDLFFSKVKYGGVVGGHDYTPLNGDVVKAVDQFVNQHDRSCFYTIFPDWLYVKEG